MCIQKMSHYNFGAIFIHYCPLQNSSNLSFSNPKPFTLNKSVINDNHLVFNIIIVLEYSCILYTPLSVIRKMCNICCNYFESKNQSTKIRLCIIVAYITVHCVCIVVYFCHEQYTNCQKFQLCIS